MKKNFVVLVALILVLSVLTGCGSNKNDTDDAIQNSEEIVMEPITFKVSFSQTEDSAYVKNVKVALNNISEKTEDTIKFELYPANQLGSTTDVLEMVTSGAPIIEFLGFDQLGDIFITFSPASFPYIYEDLDEVYALAKSDWMEDCMEEIHKAGIAPIAFGSVGYRHFISTKPIHDASSFNGMIVRMPPSSSAQGFVTVLGGRPTTSAWVDNYSLLQTGVIEACEAPVDLLWDSSLYEVCDYLSLTGHFANPVTAIMGEDYWTSIPTEYQEIIKSELLAAMKETTNQALANEEAYIQKFKDAGVEVIKPDKGSFSDCMSDLYGLLKLDDKIYEDIRKAIESNK